MHIHVLYFATLKQATGGKAGELRHVNDGATIKDAIDELVVEYPKIEAYRASMLVARNQEWAAPETPLFEGDELALMPPVSGG